MAIFFSPCRINIRGKGEETMSIPREPKKIYGLLKETGAQWSGKNSFRLSAALSYYTVFSLPPLLLLVIAIAGAVFGEAAARGELVKQFQGVMGTQTASLVQTMISNTQKSGSGSIAAVVGIVTLIVGASGAFAELQQSLNAVWNVKLKGKTGIKEGIKDKIVNRLFSFSMILVIGFILLVSLAVSAAVSAFGELLNNLWTGPPVLDYLLQALNLLVSFGVITLLFAMLFKVLPDARIAWKDVWFGAAVTALLFTIGKYLIGLYLAKSSTASAYGAAGSLVLILSWIYYSSLTLFFGAEFTQVYANRYGSRIEPMPYSEFIQKTEYRKAA
jgi:membrane protein